MSSKAVLSVCVLLGALWSSPSRAETDYMCLKRCVNGGEAPAICMQHCTYGMVDDPTKSATVQAKDKLTNHSVFNSPTPTDEILVKKSGPQLETPTKDWACMKDCLKPGTTYLSCETQCTPSLHPGTATVGTGINTVPTRPNSNN